MIMEADRERNQEARRAYALQFLRSHTAGVLATVSSEGKPHASIVYYTCDDAFSIYFLTLGTSRKYKAALANPWGAFVVGTQDVPQTIQIEGPIVELHEEGEMASKLPELMRRLTSNAAHFAPITKMDPADIVVMWLEAKWIRFADYATSETGNDNVFTEFGPTESFAD